MNVRRESSLSDWAAMQLASHVERAFIQNETKQKSKTKQEKDRGWPISYNYNSTDKYNNKVKLVFFNKNFFSITKNKKKLRFNFVHLPSILKAMIK